MPSGRGVLAAVRAAGLKGAVMDHSAYVDAAAATLGLKIAAEHRPGVLQFFALAANMAALVQGLPLQPHDEPANVFLPVPPQGGDHP